MTHLLPWWYTPYLDGPSTTSTHSKLTSRSGVSFWSQMHTCISWVKPVCPCVIWQSRLCHLVSFDSPTASLCWLSHTTVSLCLLMVLNALIPASTDSHATVLRLSAPTPLVAVTTYNPEEELGKWGSFGLSLLWRWCTLVYCTQLLFLFLLDLPPTPL